MLHQQRIPLVLTTTLILAAILGVFLGQINAILQPETVFSELTIAQPNYIDQNPAVLSRFQDFRQDYIVLSILLLIFASLTCCSNFCLCRWLSHKGNN